MLKGTSPISARWAMVGLVTVLGVVVVGTGSASATSSGHAVIAKKCKRRRKAASSKKCKKRGTAPTTGTPTTTSGLPLTSGEVTDRIRSDALGYCNLDLDCIGYNYEPGAGEPTCSS